uniref:Uncharacterized protein n=1 Tax=Alexandrium catenella TaxID=2925 RepID=A0A7S1RY99_ALECA
MAADDTVEMKSSSQQAIDRRMASMSTCAPSCECLDELGDNDFEADQETDEGDEEIEGRSFTEFDDTPLVTPRHHLGLSLLDETSLTCQANDAQDANKSNVDLGLTEAGSHNDKKLGSLRRVPRSYNFWELCDLEAASVDAPGSSSDGGCSTPNAAAKGIGGLRRVPRSYDFRELCDLEAVDLLA